MPLLEIKSKLSYSEYVTLELSGMCLLEMFCSASAHFKPLVALAVSTPGKKDFALISVRVRSLHPCVG